ncbi:hypothetical protein HL667_22215 [Bradyrhizobium sp. 83012]|uniref:Uncharacterized protein n=1 Tax=Bradyrhizobium aeschynomenes TaxID=2734909 RepID=A0ABX2CJ65_9BRAD|nr:hypothetical protein [Bradyrhizobium aeschynomenes]NPU67735.1 hypothetical protein [Bradyrhizobium aeschynomenes]
MPATPHNEEPFTASEIVSATSWHGGWADRSDAERYAAEHLRGREVEEVAAISAAAAVLGHLCRARKDHRYL